MLSVECLLTTVQTSDMGDGEDHQVNVGRLTPGTSALFVCDMQVSDWK